MSAVITCCVRCPVIQCVSTSGVQACNDRPHSKTVCAAPCREGPQEHEVDGHLPAHVHPASRDPSLGAGFAASDEGAHTPKSPGSHRVVHGSGTGWCLCVHVPMSTKSNEPTIRLQARSAAVCQSSWIQSPKHLSTGSCPILAVCPSREVQSLLDPRSESLPTRAACRRCCTSTCRGA